jgi:hypothetical protein
MLKKYLLLFGLGLSLVACGGGEANKTAGGSEAGAGTAAAVEDPAAQAKKENYAMPAAEMVRSKCESMKPKSVKELSGGMKKFFYQLTADNRASLSLFGGNSINLSKKELLVIVDFIQYKDLSCGGQKVRYGVGARLFLHIKKTSKGLNVSDLATVAAGVQLNQATVTYSIETVGVTGRKVSAALPGTGDFNVEAYHKVIKAVDEVQKLTLDNEEGVVIDPQIIPIVN